MHYTEFGGQQLLVTRATPESWLHLHNPHGTELTEESHTHFTLSFHFFSYSIHKT